MKLKTIQKTIPGILIMALIMQSIVFFVTPKEVEALFHETPLLTAIAASTAATAASTAVIAGTTTITTAKTIKQWASEILKQFLMRMSRRLLARMTQSTINWINTGFHGNPLYVENPRSFFGDIAKTEVKYMANLFGFDRTRYPYGRDFALNIINSYQSQLATNAEYTLSRVINDPALLEAYRTDFNVGGWNGFLVNTQYPQNNYVGFNMMATEELARRLDGTHQTAAQKVQKTLEYGQGFLSPQICPSNPRYNNLKNEFQRPTFQYNEPYNPPKRENYPSGSSSDDAWGNAMLEYESRYQRDRGNAYEVWQMTNTCPDGLVSTTPGSVVASHIQTAINSKFRQNELAAALGNDLTSSIAAILDALMNKFLSDGLNKLTNAITPEAVGDHCDFNYLGETLRNQTGVNVSCQSGGTSGGGEGACVAEINSSGEGTKRGDVIEAIDRALNEDSALANSTSNDANRQRFTDLVIAQLQTEGVETSPSYNGNCNLSSGNIGVKTSDTMGEIYTVTRDSTESISIGATQYGRPIFQGTATWNFITTGEKSTSGNNNGGGNPNDGI